jgi:phosphoribosylformylglycinamidine cyclo-ligase
MAQSYEKAGVNLEAGYESVERIKKHIAKTARPGMLGSIGSFGGMFDLSKLGIKEPVLVSGTDGVGTKLKLAFLMDKHDTIGIDVVAMCVNDVLAQGAMPLFFLDYIATGKNYPEKIEQIVKGVADGCVMANCALIGGETAEMPDMYAEDEYDIAGFTVGVVEKSKLIDGSKVKTGDILIGLPSSGVHSNGFSLVRKIVLKDHTLDLNQYVDELGGTLGETLLTPTRIYVKAVTALFNKVNVHAICHITGGGFDENIPRVLQTGQGVQIDTSAWQRPPVFDFLEKLGKIPHREMFNIFNMGIGMVIVVDEKEVESSLHLLREFGELPVVVGKVINEEGVKINHDTGI